MTIANTSLTETINELPFVDRRQSRESSGRDERRQFGNSYRELSSDAREIALAIDEYKIAHRRRYITPDELLSVIQQLGYSKD